MIPAALLVGLVVVIWWCWPVSAQKITDYERRRIANTPSKVRDISTARGWRGAR